MAEDVVLWNGGSREEQYVPRKGDSVCAGTSSFASVEWPSNRSSLGLLEPYYILTRFSADNSMKTRDAVLTLAFHKFPQTVGNEQYISFNAALIVHKNGIPTYDDYRVEFAINDSYVHDAKLIASGTSIHWNSFCDNATVSLPATISTVTVTVRDVPSTSECLLALNGFVITENPDEVDPVDFNARSWLIDYVGSVDDSSVISDDELIKNYVNHPATEIETYDNGNHTLSPIGFPAANESGVPADGSCKDIENTPVFVEQGFGVKYDGTETMYSDIKFTSHVNIESLRGCSIVVPVISMSAINDNTVYEMTVKGDISNASFTSLGIEAIGSDTLAGTNLLRSNIGGGEVSFDYDEGSDCTYVTLPASPNCSVLSLGEGVIGLSFTYKSYPVLVSLMAQDDYRDNGIYMISDSTSYWRKLGDDLSSYTELVRNETMDELTDGTAYPYANPTSYDNVKVCCNGRTREHYRRSYSDREVHDFVMDKVGDAVSFGVHGSGSGVTPCNGSFVQWFVGSSDTDLTPNGGRHVIVDGFGLGDVYSHAESDLKAGSSSVTEADDAIHPVITWGIGASTNAGLVNLPSDWPFTKTSAYTTRSCNNNITLVTHGITAGGHSVGNLDRTTEDGTHILNNRHVVAIYSDLTPEEDGSTVIKPTFIHIPAPLDTKDGETIELEVALENVDIATAFPDASAKALSGYYSMMSQPRVYVVGGYQHVIPAKYLVEEPVNTDVTATGYTLTTKLKVATEDGKELPAGTAVRLQLVSDTMVPTRVNVQATVQENAGTYTKFYCEGEFPYDIGGRRWSPRGLAVCGIAYLDPHDTTSDLHPYTGELGLVTRTPEILGTSYGTGVAGDLNQYNRFYTLNGTKEGRYTFPGEDKRYLLATMYQGATNTFPWALAGRKKLRNMSRCMTTQVDNGEDSIIAKAWKLNEELLNYSSGKRNFGKITKTSVGDYNLTTLESPVSYSSSKAFASGCSSIAAKLRVRLPDVNGGSVTGIDTKPIRQARKAYELLVSDFLNSRCLYGERPDISDGTTSANVKLDVCTNPRTSLPEANDGFFTGHSNYKVSPAEEYDPSDMEHNAFALSGVGDAMWAVKLRHLPEFIRNAYHDENIIDTDWAGFDPRFDGYLEYSWYNSGSTDDMTSTDCDSEAECTLGGAPDLPRRYGRVRSVISALESHVSKDDELFRDMVRYAEMQETSISIGHRNINHRYYGNKCTCTSCAGVGYHQGADRREPCATCLGTGWIDFTGPSNPTDIEELWSPFTKLFSLDYVPYPVTKVSDIATLPVKQREFVCGDVVQKYVDSNNEVDDIRLVTEVMPSDDEMATMLANYVPEYASSLPKRFYASSRVFLNKGKCSNTDVYTKNIKWMDRLFSECEDKGTLYNRYINDNFIWHKDTTVDRNMDWKTVIPNGATERTLEISTSAPPYTSDRTGVECVGRDAMPSYTRMYMEFTFSARAGRWFTTGYRQYPSTYLSPLYGSKAVNMKIEGAGNIWTSSMCNGIDDCDTITSYMPYNQYLPMEISPSAVKYMYNTSPYGADGRLKPELKPDSDCVENIHMSRLLKAHLPVAEGGIGLYPPGDVNGNEKEATRDGIHSNFWSVRKYLRPAVSALDGTDVPSMTGRTGGAIGDPTLANMFDYPVPRQSPEYHIPDVFDPSEDQDLSGMFAFAEDGERGVMMTDEENPIGIGKKV